ncbi:hypothetical protein PMAYCL1PPCAC_33437, partial [Pristionchus mayeri]
ALCSLPLGALLSSLRLLSPPLSTRPNDSRSSREHLSGHSSLDRSPLLSRRSDRNPSPILPLPRTFHLSARHPIDSRHNSHHCYCNLLDYARGTVVQV